jgi:hypothetical protein
MPPNFGIKLIFIPKLLIIRIQIMNGKDKWPRLLLCLSLFAGLKN